MLFGERRKRRHQHRERQRRHRRADRKPITARAPLGELAAGDLDGRERFVHGVVELRARRREQGLCAAPLEQSHAPQPLQRRDVPAHDPLRHAERGGRTREVPVASGRDEGTQRGERDSAAGTMTIGHGAKGSGTCRRGVRRIAISL